MEKVSKVFIFILVVAILALAEFIILDKTVFSKRTEENKTAETTKTAQNTPTASNDNVTTEPTVNNNTTSNQTTTPVATKDIYEIDVNELYKISKSYFNTLKRDSTGDVENGGYNVRLNTERKVILTDAGGDFEDDDIILDVPNARDFILFTPPSTDSFVYVLTQSGEIYKCSVPNNNVKNLSVEKLSQYSNIKMMFTYQTGVKYGGGSDYIVLIDKNGKYMVLDSFGV